MGFLKTAKAKVLRPAITGADWGQVRREAGDQSFGNRIARVVSSEFSPDKYLLSHATIVASVDVVDGPGSLGRSLDHGLEIDRKYQDYYVTPETAQFVNNNGDCWSRQTLLNTYKTFIGGHNFVEHLQIPELSKGTIVDAVARDIGPSLYVDILVATDRKHTDLVRAIQARQVNAMSMGCTVAFTQCTQCGNVAADETQMCPHVKYMKRQFFVDPQGVKRIVAELCGHASDPDSVKFIEASWVANPAFTGAVLRNVLTAEEAKLHEGRIQVAFSAPKSAIDPLAMQRAAAQALGFFEAPQVEGEGQGAGQGQAAPAAPAVKDPVSDAVTKLEDQIRTKVVDEINRRVEGEPASAPNPSAGADSLVKQASASPYWRKAAKVVHAYTNDSATTLKILKGLMLQREHGWQSLRSASFSKREVLAVSRMSDVLNQSLRAGDNSLYRTILATGGPADYPDLSSFLAACRRVLGRDLTKGDADTLVSKGRLYDLGV